MGFNFYLKAALNNIRNNKRQASLLIFSIIISISLPISVSLWASTAEDLAAQDFLEKQDFEMNILISNPAFIPAIVEFLEQEPLVKATYQLYSNLACFNAENKPPNYRWYPEDNQDNMSDPLSITSLALFPKSSLDRIFSQFYVRGSFNIDVNQCLISEYEALELERVYGYPIEPGMNFTLSVARRSPERSEVFLSDLELKHYQNITIAGIYRPIPSITLLQKIYPSSFFRDSVIFLTENLDNITLLELNANNLNPKVMMKANIDLLKAEGIHQILIKLEELKDRLEVSFLTIQPIIIDAPYKQLEQSYTIAKSAVIFIIPVIATSVILMLFTTNIILEKRKEYFVTLKDRGGLNWQIINISMLEFLILILTGFIIGVALSFIISAFIPTLASGSLSGAIFKLFILQVQFPFTLSLYLLLGIVVVITIFIIIKLRSILVNKLEERDIKQQQVLQTTAIIVILSAVLAFSLGYLIYKVLEIQKRIKNIFFFNIDQTQDSMDIFLLLIVLIFALIVIMTVVLNYFLGKIKWLYNQIFTKNSFFISNTLHKSKNKLSILIVVFILISSFNIFSLNLYQTLKNNEEKVMYYNNGSDLRIHTTFVNYNYATNISQIDGIDEVMPVISLYDGRPIYNRATVYGIDPIIYSKIGRWETANDNQTKINTMLYNLNQTDNGIIISDYVADRYNYTIGSEYNIRGLPNTTGTEVFIIKGIIHSAPGLGLAYGMNLELNQPNEGFLLINIRTVINRYGVQDSNLFFASLKPNYTNEIIIEELLDYSDVLEINPKIINPQFVGEFVKLYIPNVKTFLIIQLILMNFIGLIITSLIIDFILKQRDQNNAILQTLGNSNTNLSYIIVSELFILEIASYITSIIIALPLSLFSTRFNRPSFFTHNIIPLEFSVNFLGIFGFIAFLLLVSILMTLPLLVRFSKKNIAVILRE